MKLKSTLKKGFTLVQISILLTISSLVLVTVLPASQKSLEANQVTAQRMNDLMRNFRAYMVSNGTLPCPADATLATDSANYGTAAGNGGATTNCTGATPSANYVDSSHHVAIGMVPVRTLGIPKEMAMDGFGRPITYAVDTNVTAACWTSPAAGSITVTDSGAANSSVIALVSHGADGHGAYISLPGATGTAVRLNNNSSDANTLTNAHVDSSFNATTDLHSFVKSAQTSTFDDMVVYSSPLWNMNALPVSASSGVSITSVTLNSISPSLYYYEGSTIKFTVNLSNTATVVNYPKIPISAIVLGGGTVKLNGNTSGSDFATYVSGSGTNALIFSYTVGAGAGDMAPNGLTVTSPINTSGGSVTGLCSATFTPPVATSAVIPKVIAITSGTTSWATPVDWNASLNKIEAVGAGGNGKAGNGGGAGGPGGGGGAYDIITNYAATGTITVQVGAGGSATATQFASATTLKAAPGVNASGTTTGGAGGTTAASYPTASAFAGGTGGTAGGSSLGGGGGGGGAAGPIGIGQSGGNSGATDGGGGGGGGANGGTSTAGSNGGNTGVNDSGHMGGAGGNGTDGTGSGGNTMMTSTPSPGAAGKGAGGSGSGGSRTSSSNTNAGGAGSSGNNWKTNPGAVVYGVGGGGGASGASSEGDSGAGGTSAGYGAGGGGSAGSLGADGALGAGTAGLIIITYR